MKCSVGIESGSDNFYGLVSSDGCDPGSRMGKIEKERKILQKTNSLMTLKNKLICLND